MRFKKTITGSIIVACIAGLITFSQWWHSPETKAWLYPTFAFVYEHAHFDTTRKVLDVASDWYLAIDEEYYSNTGVPKSEAVITKEEAQRGAPAGATQVQFTVPTFADAWNTYSPYLPTAQEQGRSSMCVIYTAENHVEYIKRRMGVKPPLDNMQRSALYEEVSYRGQDLGTVPMEMVNYVAKNGYPLPEATTDYTGADYFTKLKADDARLAQVRKHTGKLYTGKQTTEYRWDAIKTHFATMPNNEVMQVSVTIVGNTWDAYFGQNEVYMTGSKILGAHSVMGAFIAKNETGTSEGLYVVESAYRPTLLRKSTDGRQVAVRYIDRSNFESGYARVRFLETVYKMPAIGVAPSDVSSDILSTQSFGRYSNTPEQVTELQKYLEREGYFIYSGAKGYWGSVTSTALRNWLYANTGVSYSGDYWGSISRGVYNK